MYSKKRNGSVIGRGREKRVSSLETKENNIQKQGCFGTGKKSLMEVCSLFISAQIACCCFMYREKKKKAEVQRTAGGRIDARGQ
jgi:hypothetical protein